ncbi:hypothetical protein DPX16_18705 [Anabarilius grahami]|uniref:Uncharacterized protein n=1 Tax=Anabarilius grahami TaxID=495550 RepID=A0A3N0Z1B6_ANAGA|nr:hypothetical protein DPX16_18705 [Anabarilius grahami]
MAQSSSDKPARRLLTPACVELRERERQRRSTPSSQWSQIGFCHICGVGAGGQSPAEDITSPIPDPEPSQPPPTRCMERRAADREPEPAAMREPVKRTEPTIAPEPEPHRV